MKKFFADDVENSENCGKIRLMFYDEAGFGRISKPYNCWCPAGVRPNVPCHHVREYVYAYGAVDPINGDSSFIIAPRCNSAWTSAFFENISKEFPADYILLCGDNASWHKSEKLNLPDNIALFFIPAYTPEMNPMEQIWREIRTCGFKNVLFKSLNSVVEKLCDVLPSLSCDTVRSIACRDWFLSCF